MAIFLNRAAAAALPLVPRRARAAQLLHTSAAASAITKFTFPAMSPTMTEGGLAEWKVREGTAFAQGDVLLDIETDKATMDVEAPEDGVLAKILVPDGSKDVPVGKLIALLAEEGDDLTNIDIPKDDSDAAPAPASASAASAPSSSGAAPHQHASSSSSSSSLLPPPPGGRPWLPSVARLLVERRIADPSQITGTGLHGVLTKGDVLAFLGEASSPTGTYTPPAPSAGVASLYGAPAGAASTRTNASSATKTNTKPATPEQPLSGAALRALIIGGLVDATHNATAPALAPTPAPAPTPTPAPAPKPTFDDVLAGYL